MQSQHEHEPYIVSFFTRACWSVMETSQVCFVAKAGLGLGLAGL